MEKEFIPYKIALQLKELGFNEPCLAFYNTKVDESLSFVDLFGFLDEKIIDDYYYNRLGLYVSAPTFSQAFRWFREKYKLYPEIGLHDREDEETWRFTISILGYYELAYNQDISKEAYYKTYEEAELACIKKLIEIIKENGK